jgi:hypothetical protein
MKLITVLALAMASVITANAGDTPSTYYKVKISADATLQTSIDKTARAKVTTSDVIKALIDQYDRTNINNLPSTKASDYDLIASYAGGNDQVMGAATYFLVRARGQGNQFKTRIPSSILRTNGGEAVFKRVFTANSSTVKVNVTDSFSTLNLNTATLDIRAQGLADAQVTVKNVNDGNPGDEFLSLVKNEFEGHHVIGTVDADGVGTINAKIEGKLKTETFDDLPTLIWFDL